jgi:hypothetical protein
MKSPTEKPRAGLISVHGQPYHLAQGKRYNMKSCNDNSKKRGIEVKYI